MSERIPATEEPVDAGSFTEWLERQQTREAADVPCGSCTACCESSYFIHVTPADTAALAHIPAALLFRAPGQPAGHFVMGFDEQGHCAMLKDGACSIYAHRPQTCRDYDCRIFAATGIPAGEAGTAKSQKRKVDARAARWQFSDDAALGALRRVAAWLVEQPDAPANPTHRALLSLDLFAELLASDDTPAECSPADMRAALTAKLAGPG